MRRICDIPIWRQNIEHYNNHTNNEDYGSKFFKWIKSQMNENKSFPIGFILNTGTHQNYGQHWQALYFDTNGISYFFYSYRREAKVNLKDLKCSYEQPFISSNIMNSLYKMLSIIF